MSSNLTPEDEARLGNAIADAIQKVTGCELPFILLMPNKDMSGIRVLTAAPPEFTLGVLKEATKLVETIRPSGVMVAPDGSHRELTEEEMRDIQRKRGH